MIYFLLKTITSFSQYHLLKTEESSLMQFGASAKATIEFQKGQPNMRIGLNAGLGIIAFDRALYPSLNIEWEIYYNGLGTLSGSPIQKRTLSSDLIGAITLTGGTNYEFTRVKQESIRIRNQPLYYFTDMVQPSLQNPYNYSLSLGTNFIYAFDKNKVRLQQVGFVCAHLQQFQLGYYNDGGGLQKTGLADGYDRYFTGGGFASITLKTNVYINSFTVSYHKFSGYYPNAFELSNRLDLSFINYKNVEQQYYNKSYWNFSIGNVANGLSVFLRFNNSYNRKDFQNFLHYIFFFCYHQIPYPKYLSAGMSYFNSSTQIGTK